MPILIDASAKFITRGLTRENGALYSHSRRPARRGAEVKGGAFDRFSPIAYTVPV